MSSKLSPLSIVKNHLNTLKVSENNKKIISISDLFIQFGIPILLGIFLYCSEFNFSGNVLITAGSIITTLMTAVAIFIFQIRIQFWSDKDNLKNTLLDDDDIELIDELFANVMWVIFVGLILTITLIINDILAFNGFQFRFTEALALVLATNLIFVIFMCLKRLSRAYDRVGRHIQK